MLEAKPPTLRKKAKKKIRPYESYEAKPRKVRKPRKLIIEILAFCLMPNHFHLFIRQLVKGGIVKFMQKLGTGYTMKTIFFICLIIFILTLFI